MNRRGLLPLLLWAPLAAGCLLESREARGSVVENEVAGLLVTESGRPAVGARVLLSGSGDAPGGETRETVTDERGQFLFTRLPEGTYSVLGRHDTLLAFRDTIAVVAPPGASPDPNRVQLPMDTLKPAGGIEVRVALRAGDDPASVTGTVLGTAFRSRADAGGDLTMGGMPSGRLRVRFVSSLPGYRALETAVDVLPGRVTRAGTLALPYDP